MWRLRRGKEQVEELPFPEPRDGLPEDPRPFVGSAQLRVAGTLLEHLSSHGMVAVVGPPGSGKSTVVARTVNSRWARQWFLQDEGGHPVHRRFWADLQGCRPGAEAEERIARATGMATFGEAMARLGSGKPCLLVLDNADEALAEEGAANPVLHQLSPIVERGATVVVTVCDTVPVSMRRPWVATIETAGLTTDEEAMQLFDQLAPEQAGHWSASQLVGRCQRAPLAVTLFGRLAARYSLDQIAALTSLGASRLPSPDERGGLRFVLDLASSLLSTEERQAWAGLSLFPAGLSGGDNVNGVGDEISAIFGEISEARNRIVRLHDLGLACRCDAGVRVPACLGPDDAAADVDAETVLGFWRHYVDWGRHAVASGEGDPWLIRQQPNLNQLAAAETPPDGVLEMACAALLVHDSGHTHDSLDSTLVRLAQAGVGNGRPPQVLAATAEVLLDRGRFDAAVLVAAVNVDGQRAADDRAAQADGLALLGRAETSASGYPDAARHLTAALVGYEELANVAGRASTHLEIGRVELARGRLDDAEAHLTKALTAFAETGSAIGQATTRLELVRVDLARGHHDMAQLHLGDARTSFEEAGDQVGQANASLQLGQVDLAAGRLDEAEQDLIDALSGYESVNDRLGAANASLQLGQVDLVRGRLGPAEGRLRDALAGYQAVGDRVGQANAGLQLGQIDLTAGRHGAAEGRFSDALAGYQLIGDRLGQANASLQLAQVALAGGQLEDAQRRLVVAQDGYDEIGDRLGQANGRHLIAIVTELSGAPGQAVSDFDEAAAIYARIGRHDSAGWNLAAAARCCTGKVERRDYAARAMAHLQTAGLAEEAAKIAAELDLEVPEHPTSER